VAGYFPPPLPSCTLRRIPALTRSLRLPFLFFSSQQPVELFMIVVLQGTPFFFLFLYIRSKAISQRLARIYRYAIRAPSNFSSLLFPFFSSFSPSLLVVVQLQNSRTLHNSTAAITPDFSEFPLTQLSLLSFLPRQKVEPPTIRRSNFVFSPMFHPGEDSKQLCSRRYNDTVNCTTLPLLHTPG